MWVLLALFYVETSDIPVDIRVYDAVIFETEQQCFDNLMHNKDSIVKSLSDLKISNRYSAKCIDANKYIEVKQAVGAMQS